jgi:hypothetical protein
MTDAPGDIINTVPFFQTKALSKTNTAITKGQLCAFDTDGWGPAGAASVGPFGVMTSPGIAAIVATQQDITILRLGAVRVLKTAGAAISDGQAVQAGAVGAVVVYAAGSKVGQALETVVAGATSVAIFLSGGPGV